MVDTAVSRHPHPVRVGCPNHSGVALQKEGPTAVCVNLLKGVELKEDVAHIGVEDEGVVVPPLVQELAVQVKPG